MTRRRWSTWREAMSQALYGDTGFYRACGAPASAFRTAAHASPLWPAALRTLAARVDEALGHPPEFTVVDVGAGGGELLAGLAGAAPERWSLVGVEFAGRPDDLPDRVRWQPEPPASVTGLLLAVELLDVVPVDVVERTENGPRLVEVDEAGEERLGAAPGPQDLAWLQRWWPLADVGDRGEIGVPRDELWRRLTASLSRGLAVAVDYAADPRRDLTGTLTAYRGGHQVSPVPDGTCDLTAHVRFESLRDDGDALLEQREALQTLGVSGSRPAYDGDVPSYLEALARAGEAAELTDPHGLGGFTWLVHHADVTMMYLKSPELENG